MILFGYLLIASTTGELFTFSFELLSEFVASALKALVSSRLSCIYILIRISTALAKKGILQPHVLKNSSDTSALVTINAKLANITPIGAPACAKAP